MRTALYTKHVELGAKVVDFSGWDMPVHYDSVLAEHAAVRTGVGIFDVSHMGWIGIQGPDAEIYLDYLSTNDIVGKEDGSATYTVWCTEEGMCVDDLIVYRRSPTQFFVVVNAGNRHKDLEHLKTHAVGKKVTITDHYADFGILAIQGPKAVDLISNYFAFDAQKIKPMHFTERMSASGHPFILSRTGYTGSDGFEIYAQNPLIMECWTDLLEAGKPYGIKPIGLGARDTLRLEKGYALYGHEISDAIAPTESVSAWTVKWHKPDFLGKAALEALEISGRKRTEYGVVLTGKGIAREGCLVLEKGRQIGRVTSGTFAQTLGRAIAIVLVEKKLSKGDSVDIQIRNNVCSAEVVSLPFLK